MMQVFQEEVEVEVEEEKVVLNLVVYVRMSGVGLNDLSHMQHSSGRSLCHHQMGFFDKCVAKNYSKLA